MNNLVIAIDYDDTFTADPVLWSQFIKDAQRKGHRIYCVTARRDSEENREQLKTHFAHYNIKLTTVFCNLKAKLKTMEDRGVRVNIWIDDAPFAIIEGY